MVNIDEMCRVVESYIYYRKQIVVRIEIRYNFQHLDKDVDLLKKAYSIAIHYLNNN